MNPALISAIAGVSTLFGLLAMLAFFFLQHQASSVERSIRGSIREVVEGEGLFNAEQIVRIIADFKDEGKKLEALIRLTELDRGKAKDVLRKVDDKVSIPQLAQLSNRRYQQGAKMSALLFGFLGVLGLSYAAFSPTHQKIVSSDDEVVISSLTLERSTDWNYKGKTVRLQGAIKTNGYALNLSADKLIAANASIQSSFPSLADSANAAGSRGKNGANGKGDGARGENGGDGGNGPDGGVGLDDGAVVIQVKEFAGDLYVQAEGQRGGNGGLGGPGGQGGNGHQGSPSRSGIVDCSAGPGHGGDGGNGGKGGAGGNGGNGGAGANVVFSVEESFLGKIRIQSDGAVGGSGGSGGAPGIAGAGGPEGTTTGWCRPSGRNGAAGNLGAPGDSGVRGHPGASGGIKVKLPHQEERTVEGRFQFQS